MDLDRERDAVLQLLGFLIEVLAELPDGDSFLDGEKWWGGGEEREINMVEDCCQNTDACAAVSQSINQKPSAV